MAETSIPIASRLSRQLNLPQVELSPHYLAV